MKSATLTGKSLDYWMYQHACKVLSKSASKADFDKGHTAGKFHFSQDAALLHDLMVQYNMRIQFLADEWLASTEGHSVYGASPLEAACRLVVIIGLGADVSE